MGSFKFSNRRSIDWTYGLTSICKSIRNLNLIIFQEHLDYELVQSTNPEFNKAVVRVNVFREHRQTVQVSSWKTL